MAEERFTKQGARDAIEAVKEIFDALPKSKQLDYIGHLNEAMLFLEAARWAAPDPKPEKKAKK